jgi:hypothetical protein
MAEPWIARGDGAKKKWRAADFGPLSPALRQYLLFRKVLFGPSRPGEAPQEEDRVVAGVADEKQEGAIGPKLDRLRGTRGDSSQ